MPLRVVLLEPSLSTTRVAATKNLPAGTLNCIVVLKYTFEGWKKKSNNKPLTDEQRRRRLRRRSSHAFHSYSEPHLIGSCYHHEGYFLSFLLLLYPSSRLTNLLPLLFLSVRICACNTIGIN